MKERTWYSLCSFKWSQFVESTFLYIDNVIDLVIWMTIVSIMYYIQAMWWCFTWTAYTSIFIMVTVMYLESIVGTVKETRFISTAPDIIECDVSGALSIAASRGSALSIPVPHAPTKNLCVIHVPFIITHGSPGSVVKHLYTTLSVRTTTDQLCI